jgi:hypothetical protein
MFHRHEHHPESVAQRIDELMAGVVVQDDFERMAQLTPHVAPDFVYITPISVVDGVAGLSEVFSHDRHDPQREPGLRRTSGVDMHHEYFRFTWERTEHGHPVQDGWAFGQVDDAGRLRRLVTFDGAPPALDEGRSAR